MVMLNYHRMLMVKFRAMVYYRAVFSVESVISFSRVMVTVNLLYVMLWSLMVRLSIGCGKWN